MPRMRTEVGDAQETVRRERSRVGALTCRPSLGASRVQTSALVANPSATRASRKRLVIRAYDCTRSASLSVKIWRGQLGVRQTNLRTLKACRPAQGRSATVRP